MRRSLLALALLLTSCFEPVVEESLHMKFEADGALILSVETKMPGRDFPEGHAARERLRALRDAAARGEDFWARQLEPLSADAERVVFDYDKKVLVSVARTVYVAEPREIESVFRSFGAGTFVNRDRDVVTFEIYPSRPMRATEEQRKIARQTMESTAESFARYLATARRLYIHFDEHPDCAPTTLGVLFQTVKAELGHDEGVLVTEMRERMNDVNKMFELHPQQPYTLDELSRLVFNPFPAETTIEIRGEVLDVAGFRKEDGARYTIPTVGLWGAISSLEDKWISPDPLLLDVEMQRQKPESPDAVVEAFARKPRRYEPTPSTKEILREIETRMAPAPAYRLRWRLPPSETDRPPQL